MLVSEIAEKVDLMATAWEQFKSVHEQKLKEVEKKGYTDPLLEQQLARINLALDQCGDRLSNMETAMSRPESASVDLSYSNASHDHEHKAAFSHYLRKGVDENLATIEKKALSVGSGPDGGYLVTTQMSKKIIKTINEKSPIRQLATVMQISTDSLDIIEDYNRAEAAWTAETTPVVDTATPQLGKKNIAVFELYAQPKATQKLIDDAAIDIEDWLVGKLIDIFSFKENESFITGDGHGKPRGLLSYDNGNFWGQIEQINSGIDANISAEAIFALYFALKEVYVSRATFLTHRSVLHKIRQLKDKISGQYLWSPGLTIGCPSTLLGVPVMQSSDMPIAAKDSLSLILADFKAAYTIVDRIGIRVLRDPFTDKPYVKFYATKRVGGSVANYEAIKIMKLAA